MFELNFDYVVAGFTRSIVEDLARGNAPLIYIDRFRNYCTGTSGNCSCSSGLPTGKEAISLKRECHVRRLDILLRVLLIVQQLLQENRHGSKRDIYYMHPTLFKGKSGSIFGVLVNPLSRRKIWTYSWCASVATSLLIP
ncbi:Meiotic recombination protein SPO11-1 [Capsicum chinense]|nr:Meiotic recombination protein SPO11-1 [Capsicum chinense]